MQIQFGGYSAAQYANRTQSVSQSKPVQFGAGQAEAPVNPHYTSYAQNGQVIAVSSDTGQEFAVTLTPKNHLALMAATNDEHRNQMVCHVMPIASDTSSVKRDVLMSEPGKRHLTITPVEGSLGHYVIRGDKDSGSRETVQRAHRINLSAGIREFRTLETT
jgi:hypothetical protein